MLVRPLRGAYACLGCFLLAERLLRLGEDARSLAAGEADRGTTRAVGRAFGLSILLLGIAPLLNRRGIGHRAGVHVAWGGVAMMGSGLALRVWAARVLGAYYTRTLRTSATQRIVAEGPYRLVRHPGYAGDLLLWLGAGLSTENWIVTTTIMASMVGAYQSRIRRKKRCLPRPLATTTRAIVAVPGA